MVFGMLGIASAQAHAELVAMDPAIGSTVAAAPASVTLTFGEDVQALGSAIVVLDSNGNAVQTGDLGIDGAKISIALQPLTMAGTYHVNFRVTSADGHVVDGSETFVYAPADSGATPIASQSAQLDTPVLTASPETSAVVANDPTAAYWITGFLLLCGVFAAIIAWRAKR